MNESQSTPALTLYVIRHGQTEWSLSGQHTGRTDLALTPQGEQQARALRPWLSTIGFSRVLCSPMQRAQSTCELAGLGADLELEPDLREWDYGDYEGLRSIDIRKTRPGWTLFRDGCPNGEAPGQIAARAARLITHYNGIGGRIALFTHGEFGPALAMTWVGLEVRMGEHFPLGTASLSILGFHPVHPEVRVITLWNASPAVFASF